jgi:hypothetical protein
MLGPLYDSDLEFVVVECMVKDRIHMGADPEFDYHMAPFAADNPNAVDLALQISRWLIKETDGLAFEDAIDPVATHVTALLGLPFQRPGTEDPEGLRNWISKMFLAAEERAEDPERRNALHVARGQL